MAKSMRHFTGRNEAADDCGILHVGDQVVPDDNPGWVASLVHEFRFQSAEATFHRATADFR